MTDLRKAAEQALKDLTRLCHAQAYDTVEALRQALAQPEQEPVAYEVDADVINSQGQSEYRTFLAYRPDPAMTTGGMYEVTKVLGARPLYTAPPKQEWDGPTDEEYENFCSLIQREEAKLKEKNK